MNLPAHFSVDPRVATILGESYSSSERALRELIDNAWDAEAKTVRITLTPEGEDNLVNKRSGYGRESEA